MVFKRLEGERLKMDKNLELLKRSKSYMEMLSKGIDPISGESIPNDSILTLQSSQER